jgi:hypothetical protein
MPRALSRLFLASLLAAAFAGCGDDSASLDPTCCQNVYPAWCNRFAECDPLSFSLSWRDAAACADEQVPLCSAGHDAELLCAGRTAAQTNACITALGVTPCDDLFGSAGLPPACR